MKQFYSKLKLFVLMLLFFSVSSFAQNNKSLWTTITKENAERGQLLFRKSQPLKAKYYQLNVEELKSLLSNAPDRNTFSGKSNLIISFPNDKGVFEEYRIKEASIMHPELQEKHPEIRSYVGQGITSPSSIIRFSVTPKGLHTMTLSSEQGTQFIDPFSKETNTYIVYGKKDLPGLETPFECGFDDSSVSDKNSDFDVEAARNANDGTMRTFRLAIASTIEYSDYHVQEAGLGAGTVAQKKAAVLAAMNVTMTRVNGIYERDFSITMVFVPNNENAIFINSDSFDNNNAGTLINQSQTVIDANIGFSNYDIGHTFSTGGGGLAQLYSPCTGSKARGITGSAAPVGDPYDVDYVAHEMGHQYGAPHTFNGNEGNCNGNGIASNAYEPGSGTTIMAYAGICGSQNVQSNSDAYFHQKSLQEIWANVYSGNSTCGAQTSTGNTVPTAEAGGNYIIPRSTPYMLTGSSTDTGGTSSHTYTWEQYDLGTAGVPTETTTTGPLVRSFEGTTHPTRYIPRLQDLLISNGSTAWEKLSSVNRSLNFQLTVRDNDANGGQTATDDMTATVTTTAGPFRVTSQTAVTTWSPGNTETITWDVAGTDTGSVNTPNVDILLSTDGGLTFPTVLATAVPNDGSHDIIVPASNADNCRVMVKGNGNIFFNINTSKFTIGYNINQTCLSFEDNTPKVLPTNATVYSNYPVTVSGFTGTVSDVNVYADISSDRMDQTWIAMNGPGGAAEYFSTLYQANCSSFQNDMTVLFDDSSSAFVCGSPSNGTYASTGDLSIINGSSPNDVWYFRAANTGTGSVTVNSFRFDVCTEESVLAPARNNIGTITLAPLATANVENSHLEVTSGASNAGQMVFTLTVLPTKGTIYKNGAPLGLGGTFTQDDVNTNAVTYTTTATNNDTDNFRVDADDSNGGTLPNLLVNIIIDEALGVNDHAFDVFTAYPNPSSGTVTIQLSSNKDVSTALFDIRGRKVFEKAFSNTTNTFERQINFNSVASGVYILNIESDGRKATKKLIIN